jgi:hypothetical protein
LILGGALHNALGHDHFTNTWIDTYFTFTIILVTATLSRILATNRPFLSLLQFYHLNSIFSCVILAFSLIMPFSCYFHCKIARTSVILLSH